MGANDDSGKIRLASTCGTSGHCGETVASFKPLSNTWEKFTPAATRVVLYKLTEGHVQTTAPQMVVLIR